MIDPTSTQEAAVERLATSCTNHPDRPAEARCESCQASLCAGCVVRSPVRQGPFCASCAGKLESSWAVQHLEATPAPSEAAGAKCAFHGERNAAATCDRCGNFLCAGCAIPSPWDDKTYCKDCLSRLEADGGGGRVPWEDKKVFFLTRYWRTVSQVLLAPSSFFQQMPTRGYVPAITFQYHSMIYVCTLMLFVVWLIVPRQITLVLGVSKAKYLGYMALTMGLTAVISPILQFVSSGWLHLHLYLFGARKGFEATYRVSSYLLAVSFPYMLMLLLGGAARSQILILVFLGIFLIYALAPATIAAARAHRIDGGMAFLAILLTAAEGALFYYFVLLPFAKSGMGRGGFAF